jgi:hypothetical protein
MILNDIWNQVTDTWNGTSLYWNLFIQSFTNPGKAPDEYLNPNSSSKPLKENFIKIFITVHNQFLTEDQKNIFKIANIYPTYKEKFNIKKEEKIFLTEYKLKQGVNLKASVNINDIKIGLKKIEENVKNRIK